MAGTPFIYVQAINPKGNPGNAGQFRKRSTEQAIAEANAKVEESLQRIVEMFKQQAPAMAHMPISRPTSNLHLTEPLVNNIDYEMTSENVAGARFIDGKVTIDLSDRNAFRVFRMIVGGRRGGYPIFSRERVSAGQYIRGQNVGGKQSYGFLKGGTRIKRLKIPMGSGGWKGTGFIFPQRVIHATATPPDNFTQRSQQAAIAAEEPKLRAYFNQAFVDEIMRSVTFS